MARIVGIDPGSRPTLALRDTATGQIIFNEDTAVEVKRGKSMAWEPRPYLIVNILKSWRPDIACIEAVTPIPRKEGRQLGFNSTAQFMRTRGILEGVCAGMGLQYELVSPQRWQHDLRIKSGHDSARRAALDMFPLLAPTLNLKKHHDRAAALLLAMWIERFLLPRHPLLF